MTIAIRLLATALAVSLAGGPPPPNPDTLGVVTQARDASLGSGPVSPGTTLYDGDRLSTQGNGALTLRSGTSMLYLSHESRVTLRAIPNNARGTEADLSAGTLVFSASQVAAIDVCANDAHIRAAADVPTVGQVSITGPKTLYVFANHGALAISYHGESDVISETESYRVVLDPPDDATKPDSDPSTRKTTRRGRHLLLLLIGVGAAAATAGAASASMSTTLSTPKDYESPDQP
jgi:hypothetical protein